MPLTIWHCVLPYKQKNHFSENRLVLPRITFITELPGSNILLPTFLTGSKRDFQVANLLLATVNFELCTWKKKLMMELIYHTGPLVDLSCLVLYTY